MRQANPKIVLASASPRRVELLSSAGIEFQVIPGDVSEEILAGEAPEDYVERLARAKAEDVARKTGGRFFIGADTIVLCDGEIMGKPEDSADAERMLNKLSGISHEVITGFAVYDKERDGVIADTVRTRVYFKQLRAEEIRAYIATGCPFDKAGAYAIQGGAAHMVEKIEGSYTNVVGLPLCEVVETLRRMCAIE
jgi:septum formation protein